MSLICSSWNQKSGLWGNTWSRSKHIGLTTCSRRSLPNYPPGLGRLIVLLSLVKHWNSMSGNNQFFSITTSLAHERIHYVSVTCILPLIWGVNPISVGSCLHNELAIFSSSCTIQIFCLNEIGFLSFRKCFKKPSMKKKIKNTQQTINWFYYKVKNDILIES